MVTVENAALIGIGIGAYFFINHYVGTKRKSKGLRYHNLAEYKTVLILFSNELARKISRADVAFYVAHLDTKSHVIREEFNSCYVIAFNDYILNLTLLEGHLKALKIDDAEHKKLAQECADLSIKKLQASTQFLIDGVDAKI